MKAYSKGKVSIIVGLYNVAEFLEKKRLSCILHQSWRNLEIILVNDGSTDTTPEICKRLADDDSRILLVNKPNGGLGSARNAGLEAATGEYVWFYDVDDEVELSLVEKNVFWMQEYGVDMTVFGIYFFYPDTGYSETSHFRDRLVESNEALKTIFVDELMLVPNGNGFAWNKFYRREFIERSGARFGWQRIQQDELFNLKLYPCAERVYISSELLYHYNIYQTGNNRSRYIPNRILIYESIFNGITEFKDGWDLNDGRLSDYAYKRLYQGIDNSVLYNTFHREAPHSCKWKRKEIASILSRPTVRKCLTHFAGNNGFNIEGRLFLHAYSAGNFFEICFLRTLFSTLRRIKRQFVRIQRQA